MAIAVIGGLIMSIADPGRDPDLSRRRRSRYTKFNMF